ncbi:MAG: hypothetical protein L6R36_004704 [Xanthoria steineri]|nr:MAG: hypothetical protein L6R36_004704 [Xanthoria steineri]
MTDVVSSMEQQVCSLWNLVEVLQARVISLEAERGVFFHPTPIPNDGFHHCRAANCNKSFETQASLDAHLRSATGPGHQALLALITQTDCQSRDRKVNKTQASASHESCLHSHLCGHPRDLPSQDANDENYSPENGTAAFAPSNPFHSPGEKSPSKPEAAAHPSNHPRFAEMAYAASNNYPTPDPTASIDIAEVKIPTTVSHGINPDIPNDDPPQYTEQNSTAPPTSPPHDNATLHSQANHKLRFLSQFIRRVLQQHTGNTDPTPFDKAVFLAAEFPYWEHETEQQALEDAEEDADDDDGEEEDYPLVCMSEGDIVAEKHRRIGILSAFADNIFEVAKLGPEFFCLERVVAIWRGVGDGLGVEGMW